MAKKMLMACGNYWGSPFQVGSHHIARSFVKQGWEVAFVSDPISPLHILSGISNELKERYIIYRSGGITDLDEHLWTYIPGALFTPHNKPILKSEWIHRNWFRATIPNLLERIEHAEFKKVDLVYFDTVNFSFLLKYLNYKKSVFRIADKLSGFSKCTATMKRMEQELASSVDSVLYTANNLQEYVQDMKPKHTIYMPNGVNFEHFRKGPYQQPLEYKNIKSPIAVYVGAIDRWFDYNLFNEAAKGLPNVSFVLIGPDKMARERIVSASNIHILGKRSYQEIPAYLHHANVGIIPFDVQGHGDLVNSINPLKLYEYMACGLPVVSVSWDELTYLNTPACLAKNSQEFIAKINKYAFSSKEEHEVSLINYVQQHRWEERVEKIIKQLGFI
ncbi:GumK N-terminal domain-containing glycosyltransferase [Propionispora hippei]|uniref:Glycosyl transferases group 1 n=1 Tax=Propionispora hippei DSM 15287 TaxID=1123003 RepID=A0A1M6K290_9FIRM|nr:glycosyltransferase [Propionispora hippei]SHJ53020.1 Glycosyl transferases group 1 [Propionispora hippei DSM 15287]